jgi:septal ring-binding cell division protein DamX
VVAACQTSTVQAAFDRYGADRGLFVLPLQLSGRSCYRVVLGTYPDESAASSALQALPSHLRQDLEVRAAKGL